MFVQYINSTYFSGQMDLESKEILMADLGGGEKKITFSSDDATGTSPPVAKRRTVYYTH